MKFLGRIKENIMKKLKRKAIKPKIQTWTTAQGVEINIKDLEDSHLINILRHLERRKAYQDLQGELRLDSMFGDVELPDAEQFVDRMRTQTVAERFPIYKTLTDEARRRKLPRRLIYVY